MSQMRSGARLLIATAVLILAVVGLASPASAATCTFAAPTATIDVGAGETATISRSGSDITLNGAPCSPNATVSTTDSIVVNTSGAPTEVAIDLRGGPFAPGATDEGDGGSEIEFTLNLSTGSPTLRIIGSTGDDNIVVGANGINLDASETTSDADVTISGSPSLVLEGGDGADRLSVGGGAGTGGAGPPATLQGQAGDDRLLGGIGGSTLDGADGTDEASYVGATELTLADLSSGQVTIQGGALDTLVAIENLTGSPGNDLLIGDMGNNAIDGGAGMDTIDFGNAGSGVTVNLANHTATGEGNDTLSGIENVLGSGADDAITGDGAANILAGSAGDDTIDGGDEADTLVGGDGKDTVSFASSKGAVTVDLGKGTAKGAGSDTLDGFENVAGSGKGDTINGNKGPNDIDGKGGGDRVTGGNGTDDIIGGDGNDILFGGNGNDLIKGGNGKDQLNGGKGGHDICKGGADPDSFVFCENYQT